MECDGAETQDLCVQALRSVRSASDADLLATLTELEGLVPHVASDTTLVNAAAAHELLSIAKEALDCLRMHVAQAALRLLNDSLRNHDIMDILLLDANLSASWEVMAACIGKCWVLDDFISASVVELSVKLYLRMLQENRARFFVLLGETIHSLASGALRVSLLCLGRCLAEPEENCMKRSDLARRFAYQKPAVAAGRLFLLLLENADDLVCQVDAELEEVAACLIGRIPCAVVDTYGRIIHKALRAIIPGTQGDRRSAVPAEEFDFYKKISYYNELSELLLKMASFDLRKFVEWRKKEKLTGGNKSSYDVGCKQLVPQPKQRVFYDGIALSILDNNSVRRRLSGDKLKEKKLKFSFLVLPSEGQDHRLLLQNPDAFFESHETAYLSFRSEKDAATLHTRLLEAFQLDEMEEYDLAFLERVLDELREPLDAETAHRMLKPSCLLWPNSGQLGQALHNTGGSRPTQRIMYASTKDVGQHAPQAMSLRGGKGPSNNEDGRHLQQRNGSASYVFSPLRQNGANTNEGAREVHQNKNGLALPPPPKLSQWRRVSLATTKSCETETGVPLPAEPNLQSQNQQQQLGPIAASSNGTGRYSYHSDTCGGEMHMEVEQRTNSLPGRHQEEQGGGNSQNSRKRCESVTNYNACPESPQTHDSQVQQQLQQRAEEAVAALVPLFPVNQQQLKPPTNEANDMQEASECFQPVEREESMSPAATSNIEEQNCCRQQPPTTSSPELVLKPNKQSKRTTVQEGDVTFGASEILAAFTQQQQQGGSRQWQVAAEPQGIMKLLELVTRRVQEGKLAKIEKAQQAITKLHQRTAQKLLDLLKAQKEERRQLQLSFEQAKKKLMAGLDAQIRLADEVPVLNFAPPKTTNADKEIEGATKEIQRLMDNMKKGINDKLAGINANAALRGA